MLRSILSAALLTLLPAASLAADDVWREQSRLDPDPKGLTGVSVENARGITEMRPSSDGRLHITVVKIARAGSRERSRELAARTTVTTQTQDGRLHLKVLYPKHEAIHVNFWELEDSPHRRLQVRIALEVPKGMEATLSSASGDLYSTGLSGRQNLKTTSGDVEVVDALGYLEVTTTSGDAEIESIAAARVRSVSGDIEIGRPSGPLYVFTTSGDVVVRDAADSLRARSVSGDIRVVNAPGGDDIQTTSGELEVEDASSRIEVAAVSGSVRLALGAAPHSVAVSTSSGEIITRVPSRVGCNLHMLTSSGSLEVDASVQTRMVSRREVKAVIGDGRVPVRLESRSGDITVRGAEQ